MYKYVKRGLDLLLMILLLPFMVLLCPVLALLIKIGSPGPVLFRQKRVGKNGRHFEILKFRTMRSDTPCDVPTHLLKNPGAYIPPIGAFLRKTSLDELPQWWNILCGDMSLIGPRPALWNQFDLIEAREQVDANSVRPGMTGWAQINGRDCLSIADKARLDGEYVQHFGFRMDCKVFLRSFGAILRSDGVKEGIAP